MSTQTIARKKQGRKKPKSRFQRLWGEAEELARENDKLNKELDALVQRISTEVGDAERTLGETVRLAVHRQLDFSEKKSLLKWQRSELSDWTEELVMQLLEMGQLDDDLRNRIALLQAREMGVEIDQDSEQKPAEQLRAHMEEQYDDEDYDEFEGPGDQQFQDEEDELAELLRQLHEQFGDRFDEQSPQPENDALQRKPAFDDTVFKRLFRQAAAALHPDKEPDPARQREKHELMSELLRARKERDLITIVRFHEEHASAESALSPDDEHQLEEVLTDYLSQQNERMGAIVERSAMHEWVYREFYHDNPATVNRRIKAHIKKIDTRREGFDIFVNRVKTLKALKEVLADRYDRYRYDGGFF